MKRKILLSLMIIGIAAVLIGGSTMAWFTDSDEVQPAEFTAGTVIVNADNPAYKTMEDRYIDNVNPGDASIVSWIVYNEGTKSAEMRVKLSEAWSTDVGGDVLAKLLEEYDVATIDELAALLDTDNVYYTPVPGSKWVMYTDANGDVWLYYTGGPVRGTYNPEDPSNPLDPASVELSMVVGFDGVGTDNKYMGADFKLTGEVQAVQATNGAPNAVWGDVWTTVNKADYIPTGDALDYLNYFESGAGQVMLDNLDLND